MVLIVVSFLVKPVLKISRDFSQDNRKLLEEWISHNVPDSAVILEGRRVRLKYSSAFQQGMNSPTLISTSHLWKAGQFEDFMSMGVTHVVIKDAELQKARRIINRNGPDNEKWHVYLDVHTKGKSVWRAKGGATKNMPTLTVYELPGFNNPAID